MSVQTEAVLIAPEQFLASDRRLFIDTNVFMDTDEQRSTALRLLFERCKDIAVTSSNGIVVPTKVIDELGKQSRLNPGLLHG